MQEELQWASELPEDSPTVELSCDGLALVCHGPETSSQDCFLLLMYFLVFAISMLIYLAWREWTPGDPHCLYLGVITFG